jgi:enoyl-CoA hydratase/carnithine racemase
VRVGSVVASAAGLCFATDVALTGRFFTADEACRAGMITRVVPDGRHLAEAEALAGQFLAHPQEALRETVRYRRSVLAERLHHARIVAGGFKWHQSEGFRQAVAARAKA